MNERMPRRVLLKAMLCGATVIPTAAIWRDAAAAAAAAASSAPMVDNTDPTAQALGYVPNTAKIDPKTHPTYMPGQHCALCAQFQGKTGDKQGPCILFPGKQVYATGWCSGFAMKPA